MDIRKVYFDEPDEKVEREWARYNRKRQIQAIIMIIILLFVFKGTVLFWLKFSIAIPTGYERQDINVAMQPIQINYSDEKQEASKFEYKTLLDKEKYVEITPQAKYIISGLVVAYNYTFLYRNEFFDSAALYDIGISWGRLADKKFYNRYFSSYSQKEGEGRVLWTRPKTPRIPGYGKDFNFDLLPFSHTHIVPANRNVMAALLTINRWDIVELEGYLINMRYVDRYNRVHFSKTSLSRNDSTSGDQGNGNCEQMYVTRVKIGHFVYQ